MLTDRGKRPVVEVNPPAGYKATPLTARSVSAVLAEAGHAKARTRNALPVTSGWRAWDSEEGGVRVTWCDASPGPGSDAFRAAAFGRYAEAIKAAGWRVRWDVSGDFLIVGDPTGREPQPATEAADGE